MGALLSLPASWWPQLSFEVNTPFPLGLLLAKKKHNFPAFFIGFIGNVLGFAPFWTFFSWSSHLVVPKSVIVLQLSLTDIADFRYCAYQMMYTSPGRLWPCGHCSIFGPLILRSPSVEQFLLFCLVAVCHLVAHIKLLIILLILSLQIPFLSSEQKDVC